MPQKNISLREIERSISVNCAIDRKAFKALTLTRWHTGVNQGIARCIFIYIGLKCGYSSEEICDYLAITGVEYQHKADVLDTMYAGGKELFNTIGATPSYHEMNNTYLVFFRKLLLAQNYLRYRWGYIA
jgi:hypothetical protein